MQQLVCGCVICGSVFSGNFDADNTIDSKFVDANIKIFRACSKYLNVEVDKISDDLKFDLSSDPLPFCSSCLLPAHKILTLHEQIESLTHEINIVVTDLKTSIFKCYYDKNVTSKETGRNRKKITASIQKKISHYRHLVVSDSSRLSSENTYHTGLDTIKPEPLHEDEPFEDDFVECNLPSVQSNDETYSSEDDLEYRKPAEPASVSPPAKLSESILAIMKVHGMDKRKLVIKLPRSNKSEEITHSIPERRKNQSTSSRSRRGPLSATQEKKTPAVVEVKNKRLFYFDIELILLEDEMQCGNCNRKFPSERSIRRHIETFHMNFGHHKSVKKPSEIEIATARNRLYRMRKKQGLCIKYNFKSGAKPTEKNGKIFFKGVEMIDLQKDGKKNMQWQCAKCQKYASSKRSIMRHILSYHDPIYRDELLSRLPQSSSGNRIYLGVEIVIYDDEKLACGTCWTTFRTFEYIQKHIQRNHPELNTTASETKCKQNDNNGKNDDNSSVIVEKRKNEDLHYTDLGLLYKGIFCTKKKGGIKGYFCGFRKNSSSPICDVEFLSSSKLIEHLDAIHLAKIPVKDINYLNSKKTKVRIPQVNLKHSRQVKTLKKSNTLIQGSDGKKFYCDIEIIEMKDGQLKCGKCFRLFETQRSIYRHIEMAHWIHRKKPITKKQVKSITEAKKRWKLKAKEQGLYPKSKPKGEKGPEHDLIYYGVELADTKDGHFACGSCWQIFKEQLHVKNHIRHNHCNSNEHNDEQQENSAENNTEMDLAKNERAYFTKDGFTHNGVFCKKLDNDQGFKCGYKECGDKLADYEFSTAYLLVRHIRATHLDKSRENIIKVRNKFVTMENERKYFVGIEVIQLEDGLWECGKCRKLSVSEDAMKSHIYEYHDTAVRQLKFFKKIDDGSSGIENRNFEGVDITANEGRLICNACWKSYPTMRLIKYHIRNTHPDELLKVSTEEAPANANDSPEKEDENEYKGSIVENKNLSVKSEDVCLKNKDSVPECEDVNNKCAKTEKTKKIDKISNQNSSHAQKGKESKEKDSYLTGEGFVYNGVLCKKVEESDKYKCGFRRINGAVCKYEFHNTYTLVNHIRREHLDKKVTKSSKRNQTYYTEDGRRLFAGVELIEKDEDHFQCGGCQKIYRKKQLSSMMGHIIRMHITDSACSFNCEDCGKTFASKDYYEKHVVIHKDEKKYTCEDCGVSYKQPSSLIHHKRQVHLKIKRHTCNICGKGYYHTRDFIIHKRRHTGEKPFQCCVCGKNFVSEYEMKCHEKGHDQTKGNNSNNEKTVTERKSVVEEKQTPKSRVRLTRNSTSKNRGGRFECEYCDETFNSATSVKKHMREDHTDSESETEENPVMCGNTLEQGENYVPNGAKPNPVDYSSPQKLASSSWVNPTSDFSMPVLENMHSAVHDQHQANSSLAMEQHLLSLGHGAFPPTLMPVFRHGQLY